MSLEWDKVESIFWVARKKSGAEREAYVREACGDDQELEQAVLDLLEGDEDDGQFLSEPGPQELDKVGGIELLSEVGRGGMGVVFRGWEPALERDVAVKVLLHHASLDPQRVDRFMREAKAVASLSHRSIVPIYRVGEDRGHRYFAMEYLAGPDLEAELVRLRQGYAGVHLPEPRSAESNTAIASLVADVAEALDYAHGKGIVHRDIKPSNLIFGDDGKIRVVDFGLARVESLGTVTRSDVIQGTPHYMSPEQARVVRDPKVDHRTDVYSLGVVLYELLTQRRPFEGDSMQEIFENIARREPSSLRRLNPDIPRDLETICLVAMAKSPGDRYADAGKLAADLRAFLSHKAIQARPFSLGKRLRRMVLRQRRNIAVAAMVLAALALGLWLRERNRIWRTWPTVSLEVFQRDGSPVGDPEGTVWARRLDVLRGEYGPRQRIGGLPLRDEPLAPGDYRFELESNGTLVAQLYRHLEGDAAEHTLKAFLQPGELDLEADMVFFPGIDAWRPSDDGSCPGQGLSLEIEPFFLDRCEVSNAQYRAFAQATGAVLPRGWQAGPDGAFEWGDGITFTDPSGAPAPFDWRTPGLFVNRSEGPSVPFDELPVTGITFEDARDFAEWSGKRLPTHSEWEFAARGPEKQLYPWGEAPPEGQALPSNTGYAIDIRSVVIEHLERAAPVRSFPEARSPEGVYHLFGNVREISESVHLPLTREGETPRPDFVWRYALGGGWDAEGWDKTLANCHDLIDSPQQLTGFRCAKSAGP